jgi:hypothetical protein
MTASLPGRTIFRDAGSSLLWNASLFQKLHHCRRGTLKKSRDSVSGRRGGRVVHDYTGGHAKSRLPKPDCYEAGA